MNFHLKSSDAGGKFENYPIILTFLGLLEGKYA